MTDRPRRRSLLQDLRDAVRLAAPHIRGRDAVLGLAVIACQLALVAVAVRTNVWRNEFFQALQDKIWDRFILQFWVYSGIGVALIGFTVGQQYLTQWLVMRWRAALTVRLTKSWLREGAARPGGATGRADNPDQRIAEDTKLFAVQAIGLVTGALGSVASLSSFAVILWGLSANVPLVIGSTRLDIPGYLLWAALFYAVIGTVLTHVIGRRLIAFNFEQERREANFRYALVHVRDHRDAIALARGEVAERAILEGSFAAVLANWYRLIARTATLGLFTGTYRHYALFFPYLVMSPLYFAGGMAFGALMQAGSAFNEVRQALSYFVTVYPRIAELVAATQRLEGFAAGLDGVRVVTRPDRFDETTPIVTARDLIISDQAGGSILARPPDFDLAPAERLLVIGPSGSGKTSLARAIAGMPLAFTGELQVSANRIVVLGQRPYLPLGSLRDALCYPDIALPADAIRDALSSVGLAHLESDLDRSPDRASTLSSGELQRLALIRAMLAKPDLLVLDEALVALDPTAGTALFELLLRELPQATVLSLATGSGLVGLHHRCIHLAGAGSGPASTLGGRFDEQG